jgi:hypothetical protein
MPIGKDSIQKRVAKTAPEAAEPVIEKVTPPTEEKPAAVKKSASTAKKPASSTTKKPAAKKPSAPKKTTSTAVIANISPEVTEKVTGHKEGAPTTIVSINQKLPVHLL